MIRGRKALGSAGRDAGSGGVGDGGIWWTVGNTGGNLPVLFTVAFPVPRSAWDIVGAQSTCVE